MPRDDRLFRGAYPRSREGFPARLAGFSLRW